MRLMLFVVVLWLAAASAQSEQPRVFGDGVLSVGEIFGGSFSADGSGFFFFKKVQPDSEEYRMFVSRRTATGWTDPEHLRIGGDHSDTYPAISPNGRRLVFASSRPAPGLASSRNFYLWQSEWKDGAWGDPVFLESLNMPGHYHSWPYFAPDGRLYFRRTTPDWRTNDSLVAEFDNGVVARVFADPAIAACRAAAGSLRIAGGRPAPRGGVYVLDVPVPRSGEAAAHSDIWVCEPNAGQGIAVRPIGGDVNTAAYETFPFFSPDGDTLYFVRGFRTFYAIPFEEALKSLSSGTHQPR